MEMKAKQSGELAGSGGGQTKGFLSREGKEQQGVHRGARKQLGK